MNFKGQHIGNFLTFLAGLIILAHAVVPHHHHSEITHSPEEESLCESPVQEKQTSEQNDSHCHAFNILASDYSITTSSNQTKSDYFNFFTVGIFAQTYFSPVKTITSTFFDHQAILIKQFFVTAQSLRAPPVNA